MCFERDVGIGGVGGGEVCGEVVEAAVVSFADEGDGAQEGFGGGWGGGNGVDVGEAVGALEGISDGVVCVRAW